MKTMVAICLFLASFAGAAWADEHDAPAVAGHKYSCTIQTPLNGAGYCAKVQDGDHAYKCMDSGRAGQRLTCYTPNGTGGWNTYTRCETYNCREDDDCSDKCS
jgi:hypothetical protein